ncbi:MAG: FecR domain-containing protein [Dyadobacter sp.]|uniref:FecR domain-containing protein n=1 Tax=Dyadobacter sp. TaxID=1914288 RepID=UPI001B03BF32|nr:FecR domain-containing protein [Dyadobacter sp.]MBO9616436.1 FecR domain-containing protein [Dyadobacter sp.]
MEVSEQLVMHYFSGKTTSEQDRVVEKWLALHPDNAARALEWISEQEPGKGQEIFGDLMISKEQVWADVQHRFPEADGSRKMPFTSFGRQRTLKRYLAVAASLVLICSFAWFWLKESDTVRVAAAYGQTRRVTLPDSSEVVLNGNSSVHYQASWEGRPREIWLEGEAFFDVKHLRTHSDFTVHLSAGKDIQVLGTQFNVVDRQTRSCIVLKSGSIRLSLAEMNKQVMMRPGDMVQVNGNGSEITGKEVVNPENYSSWTQGRWRLDGTSLGDMLQKIEENYGVTVLVENRELLTKRASGSIPLGSTGAQTLIEDIANLFELQFIKKDNTLILAR